jgi:hypothetical protein
MMSYFVLHDNEIGLFVQVPYGKNTAILTVAKHYKRKHAAIELAALLNVTRSIPPMLNGVPNKHYSDRPKVEVREYSDQDVLLRTDTPSPSWIHL